MGKIKNPFTKHRTGIVHTPADVNELTNRAQQYTGAEKTIALLTVCQSLNLAAKMFDDAVPDDHALVPVSVLKDARMALAEAAALRRAGNDVRGDLRDENAASSFDEAEAVIASAVRVVMENADG